MEIFIAVSIVLSAWYLLLRLARPAPPNPGAALKTICAAVNPIMDCPHYNTTQRIHTKSTGFHAKVLLGVLVSVFALQAQSACTFFDEFKENNDGTVTDPRNGLVWKRCSEGFEWVNSVCIGEAKIVDWFEAMKAAREHRYINIKTWRLPSIDEIKAITGTWADCQNNSRKNKEYAASSMIAHSNMANGGITGFWTSTKHQNNAWLGDMVKGSHWELPADIKDGLGLSFRLVASKKSSTPSEFEKYDSKIIDKKALEANTYRSRIQREKLEKSKNEEAGRAEARRDQQARQLCEAQKQTCFASCPAYRFLHWREDSSLNDGHFECKRRCESISCY